MNGLLPIIRRARRPLLPPDEPQQRVVIPVTVEPGPVEAVPIVVVPAESVPAESVPVEAMPVMPSVESLVEASPVAPPARRQRKERKRAETPAT